jgi:hypothetical protein
VKCSYILFCKQKSSKFKFEFNSIQWQIVKRFEKKKDFSHLYSRWAKTQLVLESSQPIHRLFFCARPSCLDSGPPLVPICPSEEPSQPAISACGPAEASDPAGLPPLRARHRGPVTLSGIGAVKPGSNTPVSPRPEFIPAQCSSQPEFHPLFNSVTIQCV